MNLYHRITLFVACVLMLAACAGFQLVPERKHPPAKKDTHKVSVKPEKKEEREKPKPTAAKKAEKQEAKKEALAQAEGAKSETTPETVAEPSIPPPPKQLFLRVMISKDVKSIKISGRAMKITGLDGGSYHVYNNVKDEQVEITGDGLSFRDASLDGNIRIESVLENPARPEESLLSVNNSRYRGALEIRVSGNSANVINIVDSEDYVKGVVPREISSSWGFQSLCAQAVSARTYALKNSGKHTKVCADVCDTVCCQVYGGYDAEAESTNRAVEETRGKVVAYNGKLASTFFFSSCGGATENIKNVWGGESSEPYLRGRKCTYCKDDSRYAWKREVNLSYIESKLSAAGFNVSKIREIRVLGRSPSGRASKVEVVSKAGREYLTGHKFRILLDPDVIYSTKFTSKVVNGKFYMTGGGWGHGIGMCQWGTKGMAEAGFDYKSILKFYYHGTTIEDLDLE